MASNKKIKILLDASVLIAGTISTKGASAEILRKLEEEWKNVFEVHITEQILQEVIRNLKGKAPRVLPFFYKILYFSEFSILPNPSQREAGKFYKIIHHKDAPIIACACKNKIKYLLTFNTKHFMSNSIKKVRLDIIFLTPAQFLDKFRKNAYRRTF